MPLVISPNSALIIVRLPGADHRGRRNILQETASQGFLTFNNLLMMHTHLTGNTQLTDDINHFTYTEQKSNTKSLNQHLAKRANGANGYFST